MTMYLGLEEGKCDAKFGTWEGECDDNLGLEMLDLGGGGVLICCMP